MSKRYQASLLKLARQISDNALSAVMGHCHESKSQKIK
jgi:hypothetical protein